MVELVTATWLLWAGMVVAAMGPCPNGESPAFPTAEGFGACAKGGRGGQVVYVTNLNDAGPGSFRDAMLKTFPRTIMFKVSGTIQLNSRIDLSAAHSYVTVAGQSAPGDGIAIKGFQIDVNGGHDVVFRHLRVRPGNNGQGVNSNTDGLGIVHGYNLIFDHLSVTWTGDEASSIWANNDTYDLTEQWSIFGEPTNAFGVQARGPFWSGPSNSAQIDRVSFHHNYLVHLHDRAPGIWRGGTVQFINNVNYNNSGVGYNLNQVYPNHRHSIDIINHYWKEGPFSSGNRWEAISVYVCCDEQPKPTPVSLYLSGNIAYKVNGSTFTTYFNPADQWSLVNITTPGAQYAKRPSPHATQPAVPVTTQSAAVGKDLVIANVGATKPKRDSVDTRLINDFLNGTGHPPGSGFSMTYPNLQTYNVPLDTDGDGMPDAWETSHGLNPANGADGAQVSANGYTHLENYLNELAGDPVPPWGPSVSGDLTQDGTVTLADLRLLIQMLVGQTASTEAAKALAAPTNQLTLADLRALIQLLVAS
jgi:pectate lyase